MSDELQALCFLAGANSIFYGEKLLTTGNPDVARDRALLDAPRHRTAGAAGGSRAAADERTRRARARSRTARTRRRARRRHATRPGSAEGGARRSRAAPPATHAPRGLARRRRQFLQQRLPRPRALIPRWCARSAMPRRSTAWAAAPRTWSPATAPNTRRSRTSSRPSRAAKRRWSSPPATWPTWASLAHWRIKTPTIVSDKLNHASLIDGCRLTRRARPCAIAMAMRTHAASCSRRSTSPIDIAAARHRRRVQHGRRSRAAARARARRARSRRLADRR